MMSYWMELINLASLVKVCLWFLGTIESGLSMHCLAVLGGAFLAFFLETSCSKSLSYIRSIYLL